MTKSSSKNQLPLIPLRGITVFPRTKPVLEIGRSRSIAAVRAVGKGGKVLLSPQLDDRQANPRAGHTSRVATLARIHLITEEKDNLGVEFVALKRVLMTEVSNGEDYIIADYVDIDEINADTPSAQAHYRAAMDFIHNNNAVLQVDENEISYMSDDLNGFIDKVASSLVFAKNLDIFEEFDTERRLELLTSRLSSEVEIMLLERKISIKVKQSIDKGQKEYFLREQMSAIQSELGEGKEVEEMTDKIRNLPLSDDIREKLLNDVAKNSKMPMSSPEYSITRNYLEFVTELPWGVYTEDNHDLKKAKEVLDAEHFGLDKIKDRIIEFLAVHQLTADKREPILCFVGPPGVGKTSIVRSIAQALDRKYIRMSVGGVRDEAEIRGHRKTYVGAMPGRIISSIKQAGTCNPVFLLDEIDKLCSDYRGDPASALLEVLDPEQNNSFRDNYMEIPYDLSDVIFITTANNADTIPPALLDRMEVIEMSGYTPIEKREIAVRHLYKKQLSANGLTEEQISFDGGIIDRIIEYYTRESGVRKLEKLLAQIMRKAARAIVEGEAERVRITEENLSDYLGTVRYNRSEKSRQDEVGAATGLAWTVFGGEILTIEVSVMSGKGEILLTGQLGDVMKESARIAISYIHAHASDYGINEELFKTKDIHVHVPEGAIPKDGPSAGITLATAVLSALTGKGVSCDLAMTGELTLRGNVLAIGGLKEKLLAAERAKISRVLLPKANEKDMADVPEVIKKALNVTFVENVNEVFTHSITGF